VQVGRSWNDMSNFLLRPSFRPDNAAPEAMMRQCGRIVRVQGKSLLTCKLFCRASYSGDTGTRYSIKRRELWTSD